MYRALGLMNDLHYFFSQVTSLSLVFLQFCGRSVNRVKACVGLSSSFLHFLDRLVVLSYYHAGLRRNENDE
jgi:hypothetical protein